MSDIQVNISIPTNSVDDKIKAWALIKALKNVCAGADAPPDFWVDDFRDTL